MNILKSQESREEELENKIAEIEEKLAVTEKLCQDKCHEIKKKYGRTVLTVILVNAWLNRSN